MGIGTWVAAAAMAVGVGEAADAATVDVIATVVESSYDFIPPGRDDEWVWTDLPDYLGIPVGVPTLGLLTYTDWTSVRPYPWAILTVDSKYVYDGEADGNITKLWGYYGMMGYRWSQISWDGKSGVFEYVYDKTDYVTYARVEFALAPVPLPASAALLPLGIGALAALRKRRRSFN